MADSKRDADAHELFPEIPAAERLVEGRCGFIKITHVHGLKIYLSTVECTSSPRQLYSTRKSYGRIRHVWFNSACYTSAKHY